MIDLGRWFDGTYSIQEPMLRDESDEFPSDPMD